MSKRILFLVAHPEEDAGCRYRIFQFRPYLEAAGYECVIEPFSSPELFRALQGKGQFGAKVFHTIRSFVRRMFLIASAGDFDFVVINREVFPFFAPFFEKMVLRRNSKVIFSLDDAVYEGHKDVSMMNHPLLYRFKYGKGIDEVLQGSAHIIAGNRILADYCRKLNPEVTIIPTVVDANYFKYLSPPRRDDGIVTIGWMGSRSTAPYLSIIEPALKRLAARLPGKMHFLFFGAPEYKLEIRGFNSYPFSLKTEVADLHSMDIGLMPLPDTEWTRGKCAFKAIQYMATGATVVASPVGVTSDLITDEDNGLLASSIDDWYECLSRLVDSIELRQRLASRARQTVLEKYSLGRWAPVFVSLFDRVGCAVPETSHEALTHESKCKT